ncbi:acyl-CoA synthetase FdrA [Neisseria sp. Ec49-e6-T10]|uniref:acyl-CoA synthetase FdrA n=1 Tax=Neisseria sp. Ec49-e6-T10 TaxID=3140744 RepID=UPI003EB7A810
MLYSVIKNGVFQDSVSLMLLSKKLADMPKVSKISIMMGTNANKEIFENTGLLTQEISAAKASDLCIAIEGDDESVVPAVIEAVNAFLEDQSVQRKSSSYAQVKSLKGALNHMNNANLALISIAGKYAAREAKKALDNHLNVFIFSDNVSVKDELALKQYAHQNKLIVMGPDCGTGTIKNIPLAFSNLNRKGSIGVIGASGTGIQAVLSGVDYLGEGISHAIGLGGRDLSSQIGGISALDAIEMLAHDNNTDMIVFVSKPPAKEVKEKVIAKLKSQEKPVVAIFLGENNTHSDGNIEFAATLDQAAQKAVARQQRINEAKAKAKMSTEQTQIRGLFCGGTLASEAAMLLANALDVPFSGDHPEGVMFAHNGHSVIDLGDDVYTVNRAHPMIDPSVRNELILKAGTDPKTAVVVMDMVIGFGAHENPAEQAAQTIEAARAQRKAEDGQVTYIAAICGTDEDYQDIRLQKKILKDAGVMLLSNNREAIEAAVRITQQTEPYKQLTSSTEQTSTLIQDGPKVINIGLRSFADDLLKSKANVVQVNWAPPAGGDEQLIKALDQLQ